MWSDDKQTMERHAVLTDMAADEAFALRMGTDHMQERSGPRPRPVRVAPTCDRPIRWPQLRPVMANAPLEDTGVTT